MMGGTVLPSPPGVLVLTNPGAMRVAMIGLVGTIIAVVSPSVRIPQYNAEKALLLQLLERLKGDTTSDPLSRELVKGAKHVLRVGH